MTNTAENPIEETGEQGALPIPLPEYHGRPAVGMKTSITGAGNRVGSPTSIDDRTVLVIEVKTKKAGHEGTEKGIVYQETRTVVDLFELDHDAGKRMLSFLRSRYQMGRDLAEGRNAIPDLGDAGYTDESGVVLLPEEVAERQNDPVRFLTDEKLTPAVIVFEDQSRLVWPDEFPKGTDRPIPGEALDDGLVVELLHHETGETMAKLDHSPAADHHAEDVDGTIIEPVDRGELEQVAEAAVVNELAGEVEIDAEVEAFREEIEEATSGETPALPGDDEAEASWNEPEDDWDNPDAVRKPTAQGPDTEVTKLDEAFVDCTLPMLRDKLDQVDDVNALRRYIEAEKQGRGRGSDPRKGALDAIYNRLAALGESVPG